MPVSKNGEYHKQHFKQVGPLRLVPANRNPAMLAGSSWEGESRPETSFPETSFPTLPPCPDRMAPGAQMLGRCEWSARKLCTLLWCHTRAADNLRVPQHIAAAASPPPRRRRRLASEANLPPTAGGVMAVREPVTAVITLVVAARVPRECLPACQHGPGRTVGAAVRAAVGESEFVATRRPLCRTRGTPRAPRRPRPR